MIKVIITRNFEFSDYTILKGDTEWFAVGYFIGYHTCRYYQKDHSTSELYAVLVPVDYEKKYYINQFIYCPVNNLKIVEMMNGNTFNYFTNNGKESNGEQKELVNDDLAPGEEYRKWCYSLMK